MKPTTGRDVQKKPCGLGKAFRVAIWLGKTYARGAAQVRQGALGSMSSWHSASEERLRKFHGWRRLT